MQISESCCFQYVLLVACCSYSLILYGIKSVTAIDSQTTKIGRCQYSMMKGSLYFICVQQRDGTQQSTVSPILLLHYRYKKNGLYTFIKQQLMILQHRKSTLCALITPLNNNKII